MPVSSTLALLDAVARKMTAVADDVAAAARPIAAKTGAMSAKTSGIVIDDVAVTSTGLGGIAQEREIPVVAKMGAASFVAIKLPLIAGLLTASAVAPWVAPTLMVIGGSYLAYEGAHEIAHYLQKKLKGGGHAKGGDAAHGQPAAPATVGAPGTPEQPGLLDRLADSKMGRAFFGQGAERDLMTKLLTKDVILSGEIIVMSMALLGTATGIGAVIPLVGVAAVTTVGVYGAVAGLVRADNLAARLAKAKGDGGFARFQRQAGVGLVKGLPYVMNGISVLGVAAMTAIGGEIVAHALHLDKMIPALHTTAGGFAFGLAGGMALLGAKTAFDKIKSAFGGGGGDGGGGAAPTKDATPDPTQKPAADPKPAAGVDPLTKPTVIEPKSKTEPVTGPEGGIKPSAPTQTGDMPKP